MKIVGARAGVEATTHALRAAFAVQFDEEHPDQLIALNEFMGHARIETTLVYLRRKDKARAMETVRSLSWGRFVFPPSEESCIQKSPQIRGLSGGGAYGIRTRATAVGGRRPRPLDECARRAQGTESRKANGGREAAAQSASGMLAVIPRAAGGL